MKMERASHPQLDVFSEAVAKAELLARARARQIDHLEAELQRVTAEAAIQTQSAAQSEAEAKQAALNADLREKQALEQCQQAVQRGQAAERTIAKLKAQLEKNAGDLADVQLQLEWQAQRIRDLEDSSTVGQVLRQHDQQIKQMKESHENERKRLMQDLEDASLKIQELQAYHSREATPAAQPSGALQAQDGDPWQLLFEEPEGQQPCSNAINFEEGPPAENTLQVPFMGRRTLAGAGANTKAKAAQIAAAELAIRIHQRQKRLCTSTSGHSNVSPSDSSPCSSSSSYRSPNTTQSPELSESETCTSNGTTDSTATLLRLTELMQGLLNIHEWRKAQPHS